MKLIVNKQACTGARGLFDIKTFEATSLQRPVVWSIAGSDSGAGAGVQADLKAFAAFGAVHGCTAVAAITAQNSVAVTRVEAVSADLLDAQLAALARDMAPRAIKTGLLGSVENIHVVCRWVDQLRAAAHAQGQTVALVVDPVLGASTGADFVDDALVQAYVNALLPRATAAAALASGYCVADAVVLAKMATTHALRHGYAAGAGAGPVHAQADFAQSLANLPALTPATAVAPARFRPLSDPMLGVYAVVDSAAWVRRVLAAGIRTVQLRIKNPQAPTLEAQIRESIAVANATPGAQLFINDHWALALRLGAYGVHLGQEDLDTVDLYALRQSGVRLGLSTHSYWEVCRAWALRPSYIACGPVFATQSKDMPWIPQGLDNLHYWASVLPVPVVGIAGIDARNIAEVAARGVAGAAVITAITRAPNPQDACRQLMAEFARGQRVPRDVLPLRARPTF